MGISGPARANDAGVLAYSGSRSVCKYPQWPGDPLYDGSDISVIASDDVGIQEIKIEVSINYGARRLVCDTAINPQQKNVSTGCLFSVGSDQGACTQPVTVFATAIDNQSASTTYASTEIGPILCS